MKRLRHGDTLALSQHPARHRLAHRRGPHREQRVDRRDRRIRMQAERNAQALRAGGGIHSPRAIRTGERRIVQVAPVVDVVGEQVGAGAEPLHSPKLLRRHELIVLDPVAGGQARKLALRRLERGQRILGRLVGVGVDHRLEAALVDLEHPLVQVVLGNVRDPVGERLVVVRATGTARCTPGSTRRRRT